MEIKREKQGKHTEMIEKTQRKHRRMNDREMIGNKKGSNSGKKWK